MGEGSDFEGRVIQYELREKAGRQLAELVFSISDIIIYLGIIM